MTNKQLQRIRSILFNQRIGKTNKEEAFDKIEKIMYSDNPSDSPSKGYSVAKKGLNKLKKLGG